MLLRDMADLRGREGRAPPGQKFHAVRFSEKIGQLIDWHPQGLKLMISSHISMIQVLHTVLPITQWWIRDFPERGANSQDAGVWTYYLTKFFQKLHENEEILVKGSGARDARPLDPPIQWKPISLICMQFCGWPNNGEGNFGSATDWTISWFNEEVMLLRVTHPWQGSCLVLCYNSFV